MGICGPDFGGGTVVWLICLAVLFVFACLFAAISSISITTISFVGFRKRLCYSRGATKGNHKHEKQPPEGAEGAEGKGCPILIDVMLVYTICYLTVCFVGVDEVPPFVCVRVCRCVEARASRE